MNVNKTRRPRPLDLPRITRLLAVCRTPAAAGRACERVHSLARNALSYDAQTALLSLSTAMNEHRHVLLATLRGDVKATAAHTRNRNAEIQYAIRTAARAA